MEKIVGDYLASIELGDLQQYKNMAVFPLFTSLNHGPEYLTLKEALALGVLAITEVSQRGILVFINGKATGLDMVSRESACAILNPKLVKSYAIDAHLEMSGKEKDYEITPDKALRFLKRHLAAKKNATSQYRCHGVDYRFQGETIVGLALVYRETVIHTAFFRATESERTERMAGYKRRRGHRL